MFGTLNFPSIYICSEIMDALRDEFSERPQEVSSSGVGMMNAAQKKLAEEEEEQRLWEENRYTRAVC